jgi:biopolymer transport protein ExbD
MKTLTLGINIENQISLDNEPIQKAELAAKLKEIVQKDTEVTLVIKGDEMVPHGRIVELMDAANGAGVKKILITVRKK